MYKVPPYHEQAPRIGFWRVFRRSLLYTFITFVLFTTFSTFGLFLFILPNWIGTQQWVYFLPIYVVVTLLISLLRGLVLWLHLSPAISYLSLLGISMAITGLWYRVIPLVYGRSIAPEFIISAMLVSLSAGFFSVGGLLSRERQARPGLELRFAVGVSIVGAIGARVFIGD